MSALVDCCLLSCSLCDQVPRCLRGCLLWTKDLGISDTKPPMILSAFHLLEVLLIVHFNKIKWILSNPIPVYLDPYSGQVCNRVLSLKCLLHKPPSSDISNLFCWETAERLIDTQWCALSSPLRQSVTSALIWAYFPQPIHPVRYKSSYFQLLAVTIQTQVAISLCNV